MRSGQPAHPRRRRSGRGWRPPRHRGPRATGRLGRRRSVVYGDRSRRASVQHPRCRAPRRRRRGASPGDGAQSWHPSGWSLTLGKAGGPPDSHRRAAALRRPIGLRCASGRSHAKRRPPRPGAPQRRPSANRRTLPVVTLSAPTETFGCKASTHAATDVTSVRQSARGRRRTGAPCRSRSS